MKEKFKLFGLIGLVGVLAIGGMYVYVNREELFPKQLAGDLPDISKDTEAITPESFVEMDKGVIYEITEEEKESYLDYAEKLYKAYKHVGVAQKDGGSNGIETYYQIREDVVRRRNEKPEDMLNADGSLKNPEAFTGFVISNKKYAFDYAVPGRDDTWTSPKTNVNIKANSYLLIEDFLLTYNNGNKNFFNEDEGIFAINSPEVWREASIDALKMDISAYDGQNSLILKMLEAGFFEGENKYTNKIFEMLAAGRWDNPHNIQSGYDVAASWIYNRRGEAIVEGLENIPEKYNVIDELPDENVTYFYPTKVWKVDDNTIVVDICIKNGDMLDTIDTKEIVAKIVQSNTMGEISPYKNQSDLRDDYVVYARYFYDDLTQGVYPDGGISIVNYATADGWDLVSGMGGGLGGYSYVFNDKAKDVLRGYWGTVADKLANNEKIDTLSILKDIAKKENIPYKDAINIWATHFVSRISDKDSYNNSYFNVIDFNIKA